MAKLNEPIKLGEGESLYTRTGQLMMQAPPRPQTDVGKLLAEVNRLPPNDPNRRLYEQQLALLGQKDGFRFQQQPDGTLVAEPIPGGPADPRYAAAKAGAVAQAEAPFKVVPVVPGGAAVPGSVVFGQGLPAASGGPGMRSGPPGVPGVPAAPPSGSTPALPPARGVPPSRAGWAPGPSANQPMPQGPQSMPAGEPRLLNPTYPTAPAPEPSLETRGAEEPSVERIPGGGIRLKTDRAYEETKGAREKTIVQATESLTQLRELNQINAQTREMFDAFREASKAFPPGADANARLLVGRWGAPFGLADGAQVSRGELMQSIQKALELNLAQSKMKGQGQITEKERAMLEDAIGIFKATGQGGELIMKLYEAKMARDDALLQAHEQSWSDRLVAVDPIKLNSRLKQLQGRTFAPELMNELQSFIKTKGRTDQEAPPPPSRTPTPAHVQRLLDKYQDPQERKFFDEAYGEGAAMREIEKYRKAIPGGVLLVPPGAGGAISP